MPNDVHAVTIEPPSAAIRNEKVSGLESGLNSLKPETGYEPRESKGARTDRTHTNENELEDLETER